MRMQYSRVASVAAFGIESIALDVECHQSVGLPAFHIVGLPATSVREARERVESALASAGFPLPSRRIVVNLAPAWLRKEGTAYDLAIAVACLAASGGLPAEKLTGRLFWGELTLDGQLKPVAGEGALESLLRKGSAGAALVPLGNEQVLWMAAEPERSGAFRHLKDVISFLKEEKNGARIWPEAPQAIAREDFYRPEGLSPALRRLAALAAAGQHHILLWGARGTGKSRFAGELARALPPLEAEEIDLVRAVYRARGLEAPLRPPVRTIHSTTTRSGLLGCGTRGLAGELSLAHGGLLFLDELLEFEREVLESLRLPLEEGEVLLARAQQHLTLPARTLAVGAFNLCPCGLTGDLRTPCICSPAQIRHYHRRLSASLADRFDLRFAFGKDKELEAKVEFAGAEAIAAARRRMYERQGVANGWLKGPDIARFLDFTAEGRSLLATLELDSDLSFRAWVGIARLAATAADLAGEGAISAERIWEAVHYRKLELPH